MKHSTFKLLKVTKSAVITILTLSTLYFSSLTQADEIERLVMGLCEAAKADERSDMRKKLKDARLRLREIYEGIKCGPDGSLLRVATANGALDAATFITTQIGKESLTVAEADGKSIMQFAQDLVAAGDASKQAFVDLYASKM